jgi:hypothetical protein
MREGPTEARRREWQRIRARGLPAFLLVRGVLYRGIPMAIAVVLLLGLVKGDGSVAAMLRDPGFVGRLIVATALFSLGGIVSAYARWRALDTRFGEGQRSVGERE